MDTSHQFKAKVSRMMIYESTIKMKVFRSVEWALDVFVVR